MDASLACFFWVFTGLADIIFVDLIKDLVKIAVDAYGALLWNVPDALKSQTGVFHHVVKVEVRVDAVLMLFRFYYLLVVLRGWIHDLFFCLNFSRLIPNVIAI